MEEKVTVINKLENQQFQAIVHEELAYLEYRWLKKDLALMHTFVPESLEGKGLASALAKFALDYAKEKNLQVIVYCPFVATYLKRHPEYNFLVKNPG